MDAELGARRARFAIAAALGIALAGACGSATPITQTPFEQSAASAASVLSAAAQTLTFVHAERLTVEYGQAAMANYSEQLAGVAEELPRLEGAPDAGTVASLAGLVTAAAADVDSPCLRDGCDWQAQLERIDQAGMALLESVQ